MKKLMLLSVALFLFLQLGTYAQEISDGTAWGRERENVDYLNSVKITFLSWLSGSTKISYERAFPEVRQSGEICGSLICAGYDKYHNDPLGFTVRYGHKFFVPDQDGISLKGFYLRPEVMYSHYNYMTFVRRSCIHIIITAAGWMAGVHLPIWELCLVRSVISMSTAGSLQISGLVAAMPSEILPRPIITMALSCGTGSTE